MRLIDADALKKTLQELTVEGKSTKEVTGGIKVLRIMPQVVDDEPTIEAEPVKRGKWLETRDSDKRLCSNCRIIHFIAQYPCGKINYCPNCGAKMITRRHGE